MKLTQSKLRGIIKEEIQKLNEGKDYSSGIRKNAINDYSDAIGKSVRQLLMTHEKYGRKLDRKLYKEVDKLLENKVIKDYHIKLDGIIMKVLGGK